mmetsp:Transcript_31246/g.79674  ORF Transcript_31246/g.79674 Transcript_31246/m.79674 type:complete len:167 (-) Transcript_31246:105-605(-)
MQQMLASRPIVHLHGTPGVKQVVPARRMAPPRALPGHAAAAIAIGFLPWNGCDVGGSYSTGVKGTPGKDCQEVYQPAAAAEARFKERMQGELPRAPSVIAPQQPDAQAASTDTSQPAQAPEPVSEEGVRGAEVLSSEAKAWLRDELTAELRARNKELTDAAWQSLE